MKLLLTHPFSFPYVMRGAERILKDMSEDLAARGHDVTVLTTKPGEEEVSREANVTIIRKPPQEPRFWKTFGVTAARTFYFTCLEFMNQNRFDLIHCLHYYDAYAAAVSRKQTGTPFVMHAMGLPIAKSFRRYPLDYYVYGSAIRSANEVRVLSSFAQQCLKKDFGREGQLIHPSCDMKELRPRHTGRKKALNIVAVAAFDDPRKGIRVLLNAFALIYKRVRGATLRICGTVNHSRIEDILSKLPDDTRRAIQFEGVKRGSMRDIYADASVTVLPSLWEAFGIVLVESLACGTPVVGTGHGGIVDIITSPVGRVFEPKDRDGQATNSEGLAEMILQTWALHDTLDLAENCRARAAAFSIDEIGRQIQDITVEHARASA